MTTGKDVNVVATSAGIGVALICTKAGGELGTFKLKQTNTHKQKNEELGQSLP